MSPNSIIETLFDIYEQHQAMSREIIDFRHDNRISKIEMVFGEVNKAISYGSLLEQKEKLLDAMNHLVLILVNTYGIPSNVWIEYGDRAFFLFKSTDDGGYRVNVERKNRTGE